MQLPIKHILLLIGIGRLLLTSLTSTLNPQLHISEILIHILIIGLHTIEPFVELLLDILVNVIQNLILSHSLLKLSHINLSITLFHHSNHLLHDLLTDLIILLLLNKEQILLEIIRKSLKVITLGLHSHNLLSKLFLTIQRLVLPDH